VPSISTFFELLMILLFVGTAALIGWTWLTLKRDLPALAGASGSALVRAATPTGLYLAGLAAIASVAPFIGLAGTLWHMMAALTSLTGQSDFAALAKPLGAALRYTFYGIMVAIPAVAAHALLTRRFAAALDLAEARGLEAAEKQ
jgi:biopolymer transport protein ExbB/TolQ